MNRKFTRISQIENWFSKFLTAAKVSDNIFVGEELPAATDSEWSDMVLVDVNSQTDWSSHTSGSVSIFMYARPTGGHLTKNVKTLNKMEEALDKAILDYSDSHYSLTVNWRDHGYDTSRNIHYDVVNVRLVVR